MEPDQKLPELQHTPSHHSEDTEKIEKLESDKNSADIQSSSNKSPKNPEMIDEKEEKIDGNFEKNEKPSLTEKIDKFEPGEKFENPVEMPPSNNHHLIKSENPEEEKFENLIKEPEKIKPEEEKQLEIHEEKPKFSSNQEPKNLNILALMSEKTGDLFKKAAEKKKHELEIEQKAKKDSKPSKQRILSVEEQETVSLKKGRFLVVKRWDNERSQVLNHAIALVDKLLIRLDQKIRLSNGTWQNVIQFLKERIMQETEYVKYANKLSKLMKGTGVVEGKAENPKVKNANLIKRKSEVILTGLDRVMGEIDDGHLKKAKNLTEYCLYLEKTLLNEILKGEIESYDKEINANKKNIEGFKKSLSELNVQTAHKAKGYAKLYSETINDEDFEINEKKDLFLMEMNFVSTAKKQSQGIKDLLSEGLKFIQTFIKLEKKKEESLKKLFEDYLKKTIQAHGPEVFEDVIKSLDSIQDKDIENLHDLSSFMALEDLKIFKKDFEKLETFQKFLEGEYNGVELSEEFQLLNGKFKAFVKIGQVYESAWMFFTRDRNLIIWKCDSIGEIFENEAMYCMKIEGLGVYIKEKETNILEIVQNVSGLIFNTKKTIVIKTDENDTLTKIIENLHKR